MVCKSYDKSFTYNACICICGCDCFCCSVLKCFNQRIKIFTHFTNHLILYKRHISATQFGGVWMFWGFLILEVKQLSKAIRVVIFLSFHFNSF